MRRVFTAFAATLLVSGLIFANQSHMVHAANDSPQSSNTTVAVDEHVDSDHAAAQTHDDSESHESSDGHSPAQHHFGIIFAMFAFVLVAAKLGSAVERYGQPPVVGELLIGVMLSGVGYLGWGFIDQIVANEVIAWIAQFGALLLLFSIGLESNIKELVKVGPSSMKVAALGVILPFFLGTYVFGSIFYGDESSNARLFLGAALVATSVGITSSVLKTLKLTKKRAAKTFLGATVIDDLVGLIVLAIISALATGGEATVGLVATLATKSVGFLVGAIVIGGFAAPYISRLFGKIHSGVGMKLSLALAFALLFGYLAELFGLEPIIGAFAAGLFLDAVHFESFSDPEILEDIKHLEHDVNHGESVAGIIRRHRHAHVEDLINSIGLIFVPVFFVYIGMQIDFASLLDIKLYLIAGLISVFAFAAKVAAGLAADGSRTEKLFIGVCMAPRGEVGLIFAATGRSLGVLSAEMFSTIVLVVIMTTFVAPTLIKKYGLQLKKEGTR